MNIRAKGSVKLQALLVAVLGGIPFRSEYEGQVSFELPVGFAGQHTLSCPRFVTLPKAAASFDPAQFGWHGTVW